MLTKKEIWLLLMALCFLVYANSLNNEFVSDDIPGILKNPLISQTLRYTLLPSYFLQSVNYHIGQENPFVYHLSNIILHFVNTLLVFYFLRLLFGVPASALGASLFAVHPIHTEAVSWVSGNPYLITTLFILGAYLLYCRAISLSPVSCVKTQGVTGCEVNSISARIDLRYYLLSLFIFSYYLVENYTFYFLFPFFLIFADITFNRWRKTWKWWLPFLLILILRLVFLTSQISGRISFVSKEMGQSQNWGNPFFNLIYSFFSHLRLLVWPAQLTLYHEPAIISSFALKLGIISLIFLVLVLFFIFRKAREIFFGLGIFALFLGPTYSPVVISWLVAERYLYFPSVFLSIALAFCYERFIHSRPENLALQGKVNQRPLSISSQETSGFSPRSFIATREKFKKIGLALFIFIIACYAVRTIVRNEDWKTPERLWRQTVKVSYNSPRAHNNMGDVYSQEGNVEGAIREFKKAIEIKPDYADVYHNLATVYYKTEKLDEAIELYKQAISFKPDLFESYLNLGIIYLNKGEYDSAGEYFKKAVEIRPESVEARSGLKFSLEKKIR